MLRTTERRRTAKAGLRHRGLQVAMGATAAALLAPLFAPVAGAETISDPVPAGGLAAVGPIDPAHGFPVWYEDKGDPATGLAPVRLELCLTDPLCLAASDETWNRFWPVSVPGNFPEEAFWWSGEAEIDRPVGKRARLILAQEAAFGLEVPQEKQQVSFARLRIRVDGLVLGATYTVTHPYGVERFVAEDDGKGGGEINYTEDFGCFDTPCTETSFGRAMNGRVGPFLRWDTGAPAGYVGDPNIPHRVVGSPYDTNFFRVEGPNVGGPGVNVVQTNLFSVQGKIAGPEAPYTDVAPSNQFFNEIMWLKNQGITTGYPDGTFRPVQPVNRDAMAAFLYRMAGSPDVTPPAESPFNDVTVDNQFYEEISWLAEKDITTGFDDGGFHPVEPINRDVMAAFLFRWNALFGTVEVPADLTPQTSPTLPDNHRPHPGRPTDVGRPDGVWPRPLFGVGSG